MESNLTKGPTTGLDDLLSGPAPANCTSQRIDFSKTPVPEYANYFAVAIDNMLTSEECVALLNLAQATTDNQWEMAMVNVGGGRQRLIPDTRNCGRIILDDFVLAQRLQARIMSHLPPDIITLKDWAHVTGAGPWKRKETWQLNRLNERLRFLKYTAGMYFRPHCDGTYVAPDGKELSFLTVHVYLNGAEPSAKGKSQLSEDDLPLEGGATRFFSASGKNFFDIVPKTGACVVFQHRNLVHSGEDVVQGTKYTVRTDILYGKV